MPKAMTESDLETECLRVLSELGYRVVSGAEISEGGSSPERKYSEPILTSRLKSGLKKINPALPQDALDEAIKQVIRTPS